MTPRCGQRAAAAGALRLCALALLGLAPACAGDAPDAARSSVLLIAVDALRADRLGAYGYLRPTSPAMDALGRSGMVFENALAASSWTVPRVGSLLTGRIPSRHGAGRVLRRDGEIALRDGRKVFKRPDPALPTLAERLRESGYATGAVVADVRRIRERAAELSERERAFISAAYDEEIAFVDTAEPVSPLDVTPTVLDALGIAPPSGTAGTAGTSLWPLITRGASPGARALVAAAARARPDTPDLQLSTPAAERLRALGHLESR